MRDIDVAIVARKCLEAGRQRLTRREERALCQLFRKEAKKGAFALSGNDDLPRFCQHVLSAFPSKHQALWVVDYQPLLRRRARTAAKQSTGPTVALILYATWVEHWLNMMLTVAMLKRGDTEAKIDAYFHGRPRFKDKLKLLWTELHLVRLSKPVHDTIIQVMDTRHELVHYSWKGISHGKMRRQKAGLRSLASRCEGLIESLLKYEYEALDAPFDTAASALFPRAG